MSTYAEMLQQIRLQGECPEVGETWAAEDARRRAILRLLGSGTEDETMFALHQVELACRHELERREALRRVTGGRQ